MNKKLIAVSFLAASLFLVSSVCLADDYQKLVSEGDSWYMGRSDLAKAKMAVEIYRKAIALDPDREDALCRLARALYWIGQHAPEEYQVGIYEEAVKTAEKAVKLNPDSVAAHYWLGVNYGFYGQAKGVLKSLSLIKPIKAEAAKVIELDPAYESGGAYLLLGRMYYVVPGLFGGDDEKAEKNLKIALKYGPHHYLTHVYLAEFYMEQDRYDEAEALLTQAIKGPCADKNREPECRKWKSDAKVLMEKLKEEMK